MGSFPGARSAGADGFDEVSFGSSRPPGRGRPRWLLIAAGTAVIAVIAVIALVAVGAAGPGQKPGPRRTPPAARPPAPVSKVGHHLLGVTAGWELVGYGPDGVVRIEFARGRIMRTAVPPLLSTGPVSLVVGPSQVIIRPLDFVPGYLVPDGHPAVPLSGLLGHGGIVVPGPRPGTAWVQAGFQARSMPLVRMDGTRTGTSLPLPPGPGWQPIPDGRGYVLAFGISSGSFYDVGPREVQRIAGTLAAVGPASWLTVHCQRHHHCQYVVVDSASGVRHVLPLRVAESAASPYALGSPGVIAPDGSAAALIQAGPGGRATLHLLSLADRTDHRIDVALDQGLTGSQTLAWSPDSRWLFAVAANGALVAVNARTQRVENFGVKVPPVSQITIRNAPPAAS